MEIRNKKFKEVYRTKDILKKFKKKYKPDELDILNPVGIFKREVPDNLKEKIVQKYFEIFLKELYYISNSSYFLFGGSLRICFLEQRALSMNQEIKVRDKSFVFCWYNRPGYILSEDLVRLIRLTGSTNMIPSIEKQFLKGNDHSKFLNLAELKKRINYQDYIEIDKIEEEL